MAVRVAAIAGPARRRDLTPPGGDRRGHGRVACSLPDSGDHVRIRRSRRSTDAPWRPRLRLGPVHGDGASRPAERRAGRGRRAAGLHLRARVSAASPATIRHFHVRAGSNVFDIVAARVELGVAIEGDGAGASPSRGLTAAHCVQCRGDGSQAGHWAYSINRRRQGLEPGQSEKAYCSPVTHYRDNTISLNLFHTKSQRTTSDTSPTGQLLHQPPARRLARAGVRPRVPHVPVRHDHAVHGARPGDLRRSTRAVGRWPSRGGCTRRCRPSCSRMPGWRRGSSTDRSRRRRAGRPPP